MGSYHWHVEKPIKNYRYKTRKSKKIHNIRARIIRRNKKSFLKKDKVSKYRNSTTFFNFLKNSNFIDNKRIKYKYIDDEAIVKIPKVFSLIDNPNESINIFNQLYNISNDKRIHAMRFDHSECETLELSASTIMDVFVMNMKNRYSERTNRDLRFQGRLPKDPYIKIILLASGLLNTLKVEEEFSKKIRETQGVELLDLISGGRHSTTLKVDMNNDSGRASTEIANHFNRSLNTQGIELDGAGYVLLCEMIGEVIDNSGLHAGEQFCQWFTLGNYFIQPGAEYGEFNFVLFNFGQTIYEGLKKHVTEIDNNQSKYDKMTIKMNSNLKTLTNHHIGKKLFGKRWSEEVLWTLYSLQEGVSRFLSEAEPDRGTGTVKLISHFQDIGDTADGKESEMCIISGKSYIKFSGDYKLSSNKPGVRQTIAFNKENDLKIPPDENHVKLLDSYFPGTVISMKFYLDGQYIQNVRNEDENNDD